MMTEEQKTRNYSPAEAREKIRAFCVYRERSQYEVRTRLYEYGLYGELIEEIISELIQDNFLNEERFAKAYVRGKFNQKKWGRIKIRQSLYPHKLSDYVLSKAFTEIDDDKYMEVMEKLIDQKIREAKKGSDFEKRGKVAHYLISRGFESDLVWDMVKQKEL